MNKAYNRIEGDLVLTSSTTINGLIDGNVIVIDGVTLMHHGLIDGNLIIEEGGTCEVNGRIEKNIINQGKCAVYGYVEGLIFSSPENIYVDDKAIINQILPLPFAQ